MNMQGAQLARERLREEFDESLRTAELDPNLRLVKFSFHGKEMKPIYGSDGAIIGYEVNGRTSTITVDDGPFTSRTVFVRDADGNLSYAQPFDQRNLETLGLKVRSESVFTPESAKSHLDAIN
jgi:hypothetical protein